ncbi:hypothetical protein [Desulfoluna spongiiphila]|uniref:Uncharacterized protein n=1 Tax=Desulfoluna spongiiphila TaxID=419481 RepID=A0A1G5C355_9BACT|nr:hypothetical protein [Desulfoluna spongiiphila]SCX96875.1 hypothetical protein SAMN05216233_102349 [Desulfoluna spongiiphila]
MTDHESGRCVSCVLSAAFPGIKFNEEGVCNFCRDKLQVTSDAEAIARAKEKIEAMISRNRGQGRYDALMCYSGGKDSTYTLMLAVKKYGLRVLSFTLDNGFLSSGALDNINRVVDGLGVDQITVRPSAPFFRSVIKASALNDIFGDRALLRISSGCHACISLVNITAQTMALERGIPFILAGFTLGQIPANGVMYKTNYRFLQQSRETAMANLRSHVGDEADAYYGIRESLIETVTSYPHTMNLLCLEDITEAEIVRAIEPLGWERPGDVDGCSSNCRLNTFNNHIHQVKYGYSPYELELSHLIRKGLMTRDEALEKIFDQPVDQYQSVMSQLGMTANDIDSLEPRRQEACSGGLEAMGGT